MTKERIAELMQAHLTGSLSEPESAELLEALKARENAEEAEVIIHGQLASGEFAYEGDLSYVYERIGEMARRPMPTMPKPVRGVHFLRRFRFAAAAVLLLAMASTYFLVQSRPQKLLSQAERFKNDVMPGRAGAKLKLSNDSLIDLSDRKEGLIVSDGNYEIYKVGDDIVYKRIDQSISGGLMYNELIADKKQTSSAKLPDGTIAWVNAESSLRYPLQFTGSERRVELIRGQAIFRVKHDARQPFKVVAEGHEFEDIGTEFDVDTYDRTAIKTTVLEGIVQTGSTRITRGQQARVDKAGNVLVANVDTDPVFAWRDGQFDFSDVSVEEIMKQAARWYDVDVIFEGKINQRYIISSDRNRPISDLLKRMEQAGGVHFGIEGRKITVRP